MLHLFEGYGIELEYMIVDRETLNVLPISDRLLIGGDGAVASEIERGDIAWSNELVLHVLELKTNGPVAALSGIYEKFQKNIVAINELLRPLGAALMPTAMHPWMNPAVETKLWPYENSEVYGQFDNVFGCRRHGWANLQCVHINLPFADDEEFGRLHAASRILLPIIPALASSSPVLESTITGFRDSRLEVYRHNQERVPSVAGRVIPEPIYGRLEYERQILEKIYSDMESHDPQGILRHDWLNSRGAIARFQRNTIEIRIVDIQECPLADLAIATAIVAVLKALSGGRCSRFDEQKTWSIDRLEPIFLETIRHAEAAVIEDAAYLELFGLRGLRRCTAGELWRAVLELLSCDGAPEWGGYREALGFILSKGALSSRISRALNGDCSHDRLKAVYQELCNCLAAGRLFGN